MKKFNLLLSLILIFHQTCPSLSEEYTTFLGDVAKSLNLSQEKLEQSDFSELSTKTIENILQGLENLEQKIVNRSPYELSKRNIKSAAAKTGNYIQALLPILPQENFSMTADEQECVKKGIFLLQKYARIPSIQKNNDFAQKLKTHLHDCLTHNITTAQKAINNRNELINLFKNDLNTTILNNKATGDALFLFYQQVRQAYTATDDEKDDNDYN